MKQKANNQSGFTIIEVLITIFLIGATLVIYQATTRTVLQNRMNRYKEVALRIADDKMQSIRSTAFNSIPASGSFSDALMADIPNGAGSITVTDMNSRTKDVIVTVTWTNPQTSAPLELSLQTYVTLGGIGQ